MSQKQIMDLIIKIHEKIDLIDDGYHNKRIAQLIKRSNILMKKLTDKNKKKIQAYYGYEES